MRLNPGPSGGRLRAGTRPAGPSGITRPAPAVLVVAAAALLITAGCSGARSAGRMAAAAGGGATRGASPTGPAGPASAPGTPVGGGTTVVTSPATSAGGAGSGGAAPAPGSASTSPPNQPAPAEQAGWSPVAVSGNRTVTDTRSVPLATGHTITLVRFRAGTFRLDLHLGSTDPPSAGLAIPAVAGSAVSPSERPHLLAAFNGGFKSSTGSGGFEADGQIVTALVAGDASLVVDANGAVHIGVWGQDVPGPGEQILSVRQNLKPLIYRGQPSPYTGELGAWGATLHGVPDVARSAIGIDSAGDLVYAASMHALPADLVQALSAAGVVDAMELDINPYWIQADVAASGGGPLQPAVPGQQRPTDQYLWGWTRDFFAVVAAP